MINVDAFQYLDPKTGVMHYWPILEANTAYFRGKGLLYARSSAEIKSLAIEAEAIIDIYFESEKDYLLQQIKADGRFDLLETDENGYATNRIRDDAIDEYDVYNRDTTSDFEALTNAMDRFFDPSVIEDVQDAQDFEIFSAVAMCYLAQYVRDLKFKLDLKLMKWVPRSKAQLEAHEIVRFASNVIGAMELLGYAQKLRDAQRLEKKFEDQLNQHLNQQSITNNQLVAKIKQESQMLAREEQALERKRRSAENNQRRHQDNHAAKKVVLESWELNPRQFTTLEGAGDHYEEVLRELGYTTKQRTVVKWISKKAAELGIPFGKR
jgi:hypothetical protein